MNASGNAGNASANAGKSGVFGKPIVGGIIFILVLVGLYYLYNFLYGKNVAQDSVEILSGTKPMVVQSTGAAGSVSAVSITDLAGVMDGGQYSVSFWMYVSSTKDLDNLAHLMEISDRRRLASTGTKGNTLLFVGLHPKNGTLVVRQNTSGSGKGENISNDASSTWSANSAYSVNTLLSGYISSESNVGTDSIAKSNDKCDILNGVEYQRWLLITVVGNGRTLDVYIDGKLARSCVYVSPFALGTNDSTARAYFGLNNDGKLKGFFSNGKFYNYALTPDAVWAIYQQGPGGSFSFTDFFKNLFNIDVSFSTTAQMNTPTSQTTTPTTTAI